MEAYKQEFIEFMVESDVLKFGDFTLKSGRNRIFYECGCLCDRFPVKETRRVLCKSHPCQLWGRF